MYIRELHLENIKCFPDLTLRFPASRKGSWCVLLGENGTGKSTVLQAIALALIPQIAAARLLTHPERWIREDAPGRCAAQFYGPTTSDKARVDLEFSSNLATMVDEPEVYYHTQSFLSQRRMGPESPWPFVFAGYGPFRRMEVGSTDDESRRSRYTDAFRTLFDDGAGLQRLEDWLLRLDYLAKDEQAADQHARERYGQRLSTIIDVVNSLFPADGPYRLEGVSARGLSFAGGDGEPVSLADMSDGYRTMFAMAVDLLRLSYAQNHEPLEKFQRRTDDGHVSIDIQGIVVIDEVDIHLHPRWQQEIGQYLQRVFPKVQFIVATHSPFVAQSATEGCLFVLQRNPGSTDVDVDPTLPSLHGLPAEEILLSPAFRLETTRDPETDRLLDEHTRLAALKERGKLSATDEARLADLSRKLEPVLRMEEAYARDVWDQLRKGPKP